MNELDIGKEVSLDAGKIKSILVAGAGVMGRGIASVFASKGFEVWLMDISDGILRDALHDIKSGPFGLEKQVEKGKIKDAQMQNILSGIHTTLDIDQAQNIDFVLEAISEDPEPKKALFQKLDKKCRSDVIFASNTSSILIAEIASFVERKDKVIGMHWFNPPVAMKLIEVIKSGISSPETVSRTEELCRFVGKTPIVVNDVPGFFTTSFYITMALEGIRKLEEGAAKISEIDEMCKLAYGHPLGPFSLMDLAGLDVTLHISEQLYEYTHDNRYHPPITLRKLVLAGFLGDPRVKSGSKGGWYEYFGLKRA